MKTSTNGHRAGVLMTAAFALFTVLSVTAQFGTQESIVPNRIPPADIPGISGDGGNSSQRAPSGSISVAENATYNAMTPQQLVQNVLVTGCLQAENIRFGYYNRNNGNWTNHTWSSTPGNRMLGYFERATSGFALEEGLVLSTGRISSAMGPNNNAGRSDQMVSNASDPDLATISGRTMYDAAVLEFDFIPAGNTVEFKYVFASEEYLEYVHTNFNDAFGFFLSGPGISGPYSNNAINLATLPNGEDVTINTIHPAGVNTNGQSYPAHNAEYYIDNPSGSLTMQFDGYTVELTATYPVTPCATYRIKMAIADASDQQWDAAVFLGARSFNAETLSLTHFGNGIQDNNNVFEGCTNNRLVVSRLTTDLSEDYHVDLILAGSAINGTDILTSDGQPFPTQIVIPAGQASYEIPYYAVNDGTGDNAETFIVRVRNSCPCDENISYVEEVINIYEQVTIASVSATNAQCAGQSNGVITINATGGSGSYLYSINNGTTWQSSNTFTGLSAGSYTVLVRDPGSCYEPVSAAATIGEPQPIVANAGSDVSICSGTSTQLNGTGGVLYSWSPATGLSNPSIANPVASPAVTTTYTLTVTNASGQCASTDQVIVTVNPSPVITVNPAEIEVCRGTEVTITASGAASYVWNPGGATSVSITVNPVSNTSYTVTGTAANGCTGTASSLVIVKATPGNVNAGADASIGLCETHQLQGSATGSGTLLYTWTPSTGLSNANIANPVFTPSTSGTYTFTLTVTNQASGCSVSDEMSIEVAEPLAVTSVVNNNSCTTVADGSIDITVTGGSAPYAYSWTGPNGYTAGTEDLSNIVAGTYTVVVTDSDGCTFTGNYTVGTVPDTTPPTASNPADIVLSGCNGTFPDPDILVVTDENDNCETPVVAWVSDGSPVLDGCTETIVRTYSVTDGSGNSINVYQNLIRTIDTEAPVISTVAESADLGCNPTVVAPVFTGLDNCAGEFTPEVTTTGVISEGCAYSQTWTANYTDACGNVAEEVSITYTWTVDTEAPVISTVAVSGDLGCNPTVVAPVFTGLDNCAGEFTPEVSTEGPSNEGCAYTQTWTANYTDACGNIAEEVSITYTWTVDTEAPVISTVAVSGDLGCNPTVEAPAFTGLDNCAGEFTPEVSTEGPSNEGCAYTQTWTANYTDACGNVAEEVSITYTWTVDVDAPVFTNAPADITVNCNGSGNTTELSNWLNSAVAEDICGEVTVTNDFEGLSDLCGATGSATVTWTATDNCGNAATTTATFTIADTQAPEITCPQNIVAETEPGMCGAWIEVPVPAAIDACGEVTLVNNITGTNNATGSYPLGVTTIIWTATDECGNVSTCSMTITINDNEDPHIICPQHITVNNDPGVCEAFVNVPQPLVSDNCEIRTLVNTYTQTDDASAVYPVGTTVVWWTVVDMSGNSSTCFMNVTVVDAEAPVIVCPEDIAVSTDPGVCEAYVTVPLPEVSDNCGVDNVINSFNGTNDASGIYPVGSTTIIWTVTDVHGHIAECSMTVTVSDNELPVIECPEDIAVNTDPGVCEAYVSVPQPVVSDNCGIESVVNSFNGTADASGIYPTGTTTINWTVVDIHGNQSECVMTVTVTDNELPVIVCPEDITVNTDPGVCEANVTVPQPVVTDNCGIELVANSFNGTDNASGIYPTGTTTVVWTVTDIHGLTSTCEMTITVTDNELPVIECPEDITVVAGAGCTALVEIPEPVVSDNCGIESVVSSTGTTGSIELPAGIHEITWTATDIHGNQASCSMLVTITAGPIANDDNDVTEMNIPVSVPVLENDTDCDNNIDPSTVTVITNPANGFTMVDPQNGNILYTPNTGFHGTDTFIYRVCDLSGLCDDATVTIVIEGEDPPAPIYLIAVADMDTTLVNTPRLITNMFNDIVPEGITAGIEILTQPSNGSLELNSDMTVTYNPAPDFTGMDEFTYILYDINGVAISDTAVSVIVVVPDPGRAEVIIYNGITPNGDGRNDKWIIDGIEEYGDNEVLLFNRWSDQVRYFENYNNTSVVWDGTNKNGKMLPDGTYYYIVKLRSVNEIYTGWVIIHGSN
ncbi:MAG: choice-of-anchor L domain-containing protein [Lentimicrobium sp.]|nr:choice-of-anchor L domain-containing protein [Lentimicrobium sp.]